MSVLADLSPEQARLEWFRRGMAEVVPGFRPDDWFITTDTIRCTSWVTPGIECLPTARKADRLSRAAVYGPESLTACDDHVQWHRPDLWARCRKVTVTSALLGRTCGAP